MSLKSPAGEGAGAPSKDPSSRTTRPPLSLRNGGEGGGLHAPIRADAGFAAPLIAMRFAAVPECVPFNR